MLGTNIDFVTSTTCHVPAASARWKISIPSERKGAKISRRRRRLGREANEEEEGEEEEVEESEVGGQLRLVMGGELQYV